MEGKDVFSKNLLKGQVMKRKTAVVLLTVIIVLSLFIKLFIIFKYNNSLTIASDDLNYIKHSIYLIKSGILSYNAFDERTVFIMPLYPYFLAAVFKIFGTGLSGMLAFRVIQALLSCITVWLVFLIGSRMFNRLTGLISACMTAFYFPFIVTAGYALTETIFTLLLVLLVYLSLAFSDRPSNLKFILLGAVWALSVLCRPTTGLYPLILFAYMLFGLKMSFKKIIKTSILMGFVFLFVMLPWWIRNYNEYGAFIPFTASSGNPMLQGTYIDYIQTPENTIYYKLGKSQYETDRIETALSIKRMEEGFRNDFWRYLSWYTIGKTKFFWCTVFYWRHFLGVGQSFVLVQHYAILLGFAGMASLLFSKTIKNLLPAMLVLYFNVIHCIYMAFDRYALPLLPFMAIYSAYLIDRTYVFVKGHPIDAADIR